VNVDTMQDRDAQRFTEVVDSLLEGEGYKITRFSPSIKIGRRYIGVKHVASGREFCIQIDAVSEENDVELF